MDPRRRRNRVPDIPAKPGLEHPGEKEDEARKHFESVTVAATLNNPYAYRYENRPFSCAGV